jgi:hypothetical protein
VTFGGLPASREAGVGLSWTKTGVELTFSLDVGADVLSLIDPRKPVDGGRKTLQNGYGLEAKLVTANKTGLVLDGITAKVKRATAFGALALEDVSVSYKPQDRLWSGAATVIPFPVGPLAKAAIGQWSGEVAIAIKPISLRKVGLTVKELNRPIGTTGVFLQSLGGEFERKPSLKLTGSMGVSFGPKLDIPLIGKGVTAVSADGKAELTMGPWVVKGSGNMAIVKQPVAGGEFTLDFSNVSAAVKGQVSLTFAGSGFSGDLEGWVVRTAAFGLDGAGQVKAFGQGIGGGDAALSSAGVGACARLPGFLPDFGWRLRWGDTFPKVMESSCDIGPIVLAKPARAAQAGGVAIPRGQRGWVLRVRPASGQAAVALRDPSGVVTPLPLTRDVQITQRLAAIRDRATGQLWIVLGRPAAGTWTVTPLAGTPAVAAVDHARVLRSPRVTASVSGPDRRGRRTLRWRARAIPGQRLVFVERGAHGFARVLARTDRARGAKRFRRADTRRGKRRVVVQVLQGGTPRDEFRVARFTERGQGAARPARLRVTRRGARVTIRWARARGAGAYRIAVRLRDRRRLDRMLRPGTRKLVLRGVSRRTRGRVSVRALSPAGVAGPARTTRLR